MYDPVLSLRPDGFPMGEAALPRSIRQRFLSVGETASILGASPASIRRWADQGFLPSYRTPGGQRRFDRDEVERLLERMDRRRARAHH
jgi:excisionase family DNA binding protein